MPNYNIVTDSCCDLRPETYEQLNLTVVPLSMEFRGQVREDKSDDSIKEVYAALRAGESAQTAAVNPDRWLNAMEPHLAEEIACNGFGTVQVGDHEEPEKIVVECLECGGILLEVENPNARKGDAE